MADPLFEFDPTSEDAANSPLSVWDNGTYGVAVFSAPAPPVSMQFAGSVDTEGSLPASRKHENRTISLTVECESAAGLRALQAKAAKIYREGGTAKLTFPASGETVIFDLLATDSYEPQLDVTYYSNSGAFCVVNMSFTAKPYGRGPSENLSLSASTATAGAPLVFTATGVKGDIPGLGLLTLGNATTTKGSALWGLRSRYYSSGNALLIEAESGVADGAALNAGTAGASGGGANKVMRHANPGTSGAASFALPSGTDHVGVYRVFARVVPLLANTGTTSVRMVWQPYTLAEPILGEWVALEFGSPLNGLWSIVDLGEVRLPKARFGTQGWTAEFWSKSTVATDDVDWDWIALVPVDEGYGQLRNDSNILTAGAVAFAHDTAQIRDAGTNWYTPTSYEGDYLLIPPAGSEGRTVQVITMLAGAAQGRLNLNGNDMNAITATLSVVPRYLVVPSP
jgi:hypothetical protein